MKSDVITLDCFEEYFANLQAPPAEFMSNFDLQFLKYAEDYVKNFENHSQSNTFMTDQPIMLHEVETELKHLKLGKAPGIDGISNEFYKYLSDYLLHPLTTLYNYIWNSGVYPDKWSEGIIQPLHKKGSIDEPDNYRKLTLMACMGKIFESIINKRLVFQSEATNTIDPYQFGFSKNCRTSDNVFIIDTLISYQKSKRKPLYITFIDFSKAFDFVNRTFLYYKMIKKGFGGRLVKIIESMFSNSSARVRWEGEVGKPIDSTHGVLQGGIVSPKLFNLYLSDMHDYLDQSCGITIDGVTYTHLLYADDLVLVSDNVNAMQTLLKNLETYCRKWHLIINSQKSKVMIFNKSGRSTSKEAYNFSIENKELEVVNSYKYLGHVISNSNNTHKEMFDHLATQAQRAMYALKERLRSTVGYVPPKLGIKMFDTHILPILEYNSELWFQVKQVELLEKVQMQYLRNMLGVRCQTSTLAILADTGRFPLHVRQQVSAVKYYNRIKSESCPLLLRKCYDIQTRLHQDGRSCWLSRLHKATNTLNIDTVSCTKLLLSLYERAHNDILSGINDSNLNPKLRTYKIFKTDIRLEPYLDHYLPKTLYCNIARFRLSSHNLKIELGRHKRPYVPASERLCEKCNLNLVEDEHHCLMVCPKWNDNRNVLFDTANKFIEGFFVLHTSEQFSSILISKEIDLNFALGKFLQVALKI